MELAEPRVLICGSRRWPWPKTVATVMNRLARRHGDGLVVIEGAASGADQAAHQWCIEHGLGLDRHRCYPVDWQAERRDRPNQWRMAGPERNTRMLLQERPRLIVAFHDHFVAGSGGTSDMCLRGLVTDVPVWLVTGMDPGTGAWLRLHMFPSSRVSRVRRELGADPDPPEMLGPFAPSE